MAKTTLKPRAFVFIVSEFSNMNWETGTIFSAVVNMRQTSRARILPDCVRLAEKLEIVAFRLFPRPLWFHATECCGAVGREPACVASKVCQFGDCEDRLSACTARYSPARVLTCCYYRVCYRCLAVKSIWDWMKPYLVVKISSDIVTENCCQVCVLTMMFCRSVAVCWHGKWLRNQQETPRSTHVYLNCGRPTWDIEKYYLHLIFTFCVDRDTSVLELFHVVFKKKRFAVLTQAIKNRL